MYLPLFKLKDISVILWKETITVKYTTLRMLTQIWEANLESTTLNLDKKSILKKYI